MTISPTTVRKNGASLRGYLAVFKGALLLTATVTAAAELVSAKTLRISITSGLISTVQRGYRVQLFSASGDFKGETHVRAAGLLDATHLPVREFSASEYLVLAGDQVKVYALMSFADKLVEDSDLFDPDGLPVGTYTSAPPPLCCSGGYDAGFVDGYESASPLAYRTVTTNGSPSRILDPNSDPTHLAHTWILAAGLTFAPGSGAFDASPFLRVPVGEYTVTHIVEDLDNIQTWTQYVTYQVFDATHLPISVIMETPPSGDPQQGWTCKFRVTDFLSLTDAPDLSPVLFFVRERIDGSWQSLGGATGRSAVKFMGYLSHDEIELTPQLQIQRFEAISPLKRLGQLPGFSKLLIQNATPNDWSQLADLTVLRAQIQLLRFYTFALDGAHDLLISPAYLDLPYPELWLQKETPLAQVNELADGVDGRFTCDRSGHFRLDPILALTDPATRAGLTTVYTFAQRDGLRLVARRDHADTIETLELHATSATASGNLDLALGYFSRSPASPGQGTAFITVERIIAAVSTPQVDAQQRGARRYALLNKVYTNSSTGVKARAPEIDLDLRLVYDFLDFDDQIVHFGSFPNPRDLDLAAFDWVLTKVRLDYSSGRVLSTFQALTDSPKGGVYLPPPAVVVVPPVPPIIYPVAPPTPRTASGLYPGTQTIFASNYDGYLYYCGPGLTGGGFDVPASVGGPIWRRVAMSLSGSPVSYTFDAFCPAGLGTGTEVRGWLATTTTIYRITHGEDPALITFTQALDSGGSPFFHGMVAGLFDLASERGMPNRVLLVNRGSNYTPAYFTYTTDGIHWAASAAVPSSDVSANVGDPGAWVSMRNNLLIVGDGYRFYTSSLAAPSASDFAPLAAGLNFSSSDQSPPNWGDAGTLHVPVNQPSDDIFWCGGVVEVYPNLYRRIARGSFSSGTLTDVTPSISGSKFGLNYSSALQTSPTNRNYVLACATSHNNLVNDLAPPQFAVFRSLNEGTSWTVVAAPNSDYLKLQYVEDNTAYFFGGTGHIGYSDTVLSSATIDDRRGNIPADYPSVSTFVGIWGAG